MSAKAWHVRAPLKLYDSIVHCAMPPNYFGGFPLLRKAGSNNEKLSTTLKKDEEMAAGDLRTARTPDRVSFDRKYSLCYESSNYFSDFSLFRKARLKSPMEASYPCGKDGEMRR